MINNIKERIKEYSEMIEKYPDIKEFHVERAKLFCEIKEYKRAVEDFKNSLSGYYSFNDIKEICEKNLLIKEAEKFYTIEINKDKNNIYKYTERIYFYMRTKQIEKAILDCKKILRLSPNNKTVSTLYTILTKGALPLRNNREYKDLFLY